MAFKGILDLVSNVGMEFSVMVFSKSLDEFTVLGSDLNANAANEAKSANF